MFFLLIVSYDFRPDSVQFFVNMFVSPVNLVDVVDGTFAVGGQGGNQQGNTSADVGRRHFGGAQLGFVVLSYDCGPVRVAKDDFGTHVDEFVHKEKPAFKHLLVDQHASFGLGGNDKETLNRSGSDPAREHRRWSEWSRR